MVGGKVIAQGKLVIIHRNPGWGVSRKVGDWMLTLFVSLSAREERNKDGKAKGRNKCFLRAERQVGIRLGLRGPGLLGSGVCRVAPDKSFDLPVPLWTSRLGKKARITLNTYGAISQRSLLTSRMVRG